MLNFCKTPYFFQNIFYNEKVVNKKIKEKSGAILRNKTEESYVAG